jgi:hypothetical protein
MSATTHLELVTYPPKANMAMEYLPFVDNIPMKKQA